MNTTNEKVIMHVVTGKPAGIAAEWLRLALLAGVEESSRRGRDNYATGQATSRDRSARASDESRSPRRHSYARSDHTTRGRRTLS